MRSIFRSCVVFIGSPPVVPPEDRTQDGHGEQAGERDRVDRDVTADGKREQQPRQANREPERDCTPTHDSTATAAAEHRGKFRGEGTTSDVGTVVAHTPGLHPGA